MKFTSSSPFESNPSKASLSQLSGHDGQQENEEQDLQHILHQGNEEGKGMETVNLVELAVTSLASAILAARPIQRLSLHSDFDNLYPEQTHLNATKNTDSKNDTTVTNSTITSPTSAKKKTHTRMHSHTSAIVGSPSMTGTSRKTVPLHSRTKSMDVGGAKNARLKLDGTVVTDADGAAQRIICSNLRSLSPHIRIEGEENTDDEADGFRGVDEMMFNPGITASDRKSVRMGEEAAEEVINSIVRKEVWKRWEEARCTDDRCCYGDDDNDGYGDRSKMERNAKGINVQASRISAFVDPLDGTSCYAKGQYEAVTILVAIVLDNEPVFGVICKPFGQAGSSSFIDSGCFVVYGGSLFGGVFVGGGGEIEISRSFHSNENHRHNRGVVEVVDDGVHDEIFDHLPEGHRTGNNERRAIISKSRSGGVVRQCIDSLSSRGLLHGEPLHVAGAGYKSLLLLLRSKDETLWFFPKPGTSLWDVAAADALLRVVGGRVSDKFGKDMDYSKSRKEADNLDGVVACNDRALHEKCIQLFWEEEWDDS